MQVTAEAQRDVERAEESIRETLAIKVQYEGLTDDEVEALEADINSRASERSLASGAQ